jgi:dihydropteroate synthase
MGIINTSPDSFSGDGHDDLSLAEAKAAEMEREGAGIIDVGGASTRPGSSPPGTREELDRVVPLVRRLRRRLKVPISVDSRDPEVIAAAVKAGARVVNLVGGIRTAKQARSLARLKVPVVLMHMQGEPADMQDGPEYLDVMDDIVSELRRQVGLAGDCGIPRGRLLADPGFGFGKTTEHNLDILRRLGEMRIIGLPVLVGASRKSFVGKILGTEVGDRLEGSVAAAVLAAANGADIVRVHDVRETVQALKLADAARRTGR